MVELGIILISWMTTFYVFYSLYMGFTEEKDFNPVIIIAGPYAGATGNVVSFDGNTLLIDLGDKKVNCYPKDVKPIDTQ